MRHPGQFSENRTFLPISSVIDPDFDRIAGDQDFLRDSEGKIWFDSEQGTPKAVWS